MVPKVIMSFHTLSWSLKNKCYFSKFYSLFKILMMKKLFPPILIIAIVVFISSCKQKDSNIDYNPNVNAAKEYVQAENIFKRSFDIFFRSLHDTTLANTGVSDIQTCDVSKSDTSSEIRYSYGNYPRFCDDGMHRQGDYYAILTGDMNSTGGKALITFDSLLVEFDMEIRGNMEVENLGDIAGKPTYSLKITGGAIVKPDTINHKLDIILYNTDFIVTWQEGYQTPFLPDDDLLLIEGTSSGRTIDQNDFFLTVKEPIYNALNCFWMQQGIYEITVPGANKTLGTIDYITEDGCNYAVDFYFDNNRFYTELFNKLP